MSRSDAKKLNVPEIIPEKPEPPKEASAKKPVSQVNALLDSMGKTTKLIDRCKSCNGSLSLIEQKMGRCLTCGKTLAKPEDEQGSAPNASPNLQVRI